MKKGNKMMVDNFATKKNILVSSSSHACTSTGANVVDVFNSTSASFSALRV